MTDLNPKALEAAANEATFYIHDPADEEQAAQAAKDIVTAYLEAVGHGWQPIATFSDDVSGQIVVLNARGQAMVGDAERLRKNIAGVFPDHLKFWATHWMPLPAPPKGDAQ
jgi:hypothetical protein